jgi:hypothetical protein
MAALEDSRHLFVSMAASVNEQSHLENTMTILEDLDEPLLKMYLTIMLSDRNRVKSEIS